MPAARYPFVLTDKLGEDVYSALIDMTDDRRSGMMAAIDERLATLTERFERRLTEECGRLRTELGADIHGLRTEMAHQRAELLKWAMLFWVSQAAAVAGIVAVLR